MTRILPLLAALFLSLSARASDPDICAEEGWYGDGICDVGCTQPDPDCGADEEPPDETPEVPADVCEAEGWYGDGICDVGCAHPDPDCGEDEETGAEVWMLLLEAWGLAW